MSKHIYKEINCEDCGKPFLSDRTLRENICYNCWRKRIAKKDVE